MTGEVLPGYADVAIEHRRTGDPDPYLVTFGVQLDDGTGLPEAATGLAFVVDEWINTWKAFYPTGDQIGPGRCRINVGLGVVPLDVGGFDLGENDSVFAPQNCAYLVRKYSSTPGRAGRGRWYLPFVTNESVNEIGFVSETQMAAVQGAADDFLNFVNSGATTGIFGMVILHEPGGPVPSLVQGVLMQPQIATQRRRLRS